MSKGMGPIAQDVCKYFLHFMRDIGEKSSEILGVD
jgi:hypothetical protein